MVGSGLIEKVTSGQRAEGHKVVGQEDIWKRVLGGGNSRYRGPEACPRNSQGASMPGI